MYNVMPSPFSLPPQKKPEIIKNESKFLSKLPVLKISGFYLENIQGDVSVI